MSSTVVARRSCICFSDDSSVFDDKEIECAILFVADFFVFVCKEHRVEVTELVVFNEGGESVRICFMFSVWSGSCTNWFLMSQRHQFAIQA
jgi:hypothetical protein